ncbi:MAG: hypothetical protein ACE5DM_02195 [Candidatus Nanoarchaeia archaeon]
MVMKGTLATFTLGKVKDITLDERRNVRTFLKKKGDVSEPSLEVVQEALADCMITDEELAKARSAVQLISQLMPKIDLLFNDVQSDPRKYEAINVTRLKSTIEELPRALGNNLPVIDHVFSIQLGVPVAVKEMIDDAGEDIRGIPKRAFELFCIIANDEKGELRPDEKINESHHTHIKDRSRQFREGYIYHWSIQDELNKVPFAEKFSRLDAGQQNRFQEIAELMDQLSESIDTVYELNWRQIKMMRRVYSILHESLLKYFE